jgi:hypothetical protein
VRHGLVASSDVLGQALADRRKGLIECRAAEGINATPTRRIDRVARDRRAGQNVLDALTDAARHLAGRQLYASARQATGGVVDGGLRPKRTKDALSNAARRAA